MGGLETYVRGLVPALLGLRPQLRLTVFVTPRGKEALASEPWGGEVELVANRFLRIPYTKALAELTLVGRLAAARGADLLHSIAMIGPMRPPIASVVTIADVIWLREPESVPALTRALWRAAVPLGARRARRVIALSEAARREIADDLRISLDRIEVVRLGAGIRHANATPAAELRSRLSLGRGPLVLAVSALSAHKNVGVLVEAMSRLRDSFPDVVLVVAGNPTRHGEELLARARELSLEQAVVLPGWVETVDLEGLFRAAACFVFPSRREGFGLPVLEAMVRGVPVACANASALPEVAGEAALYFDPEDPDDVASAVGRILGDQGLAARLRAAGESRAAEFTWERTAEQTLAVYERALAG
jgi:glycosyltransferase involved in cell wall biosynthesis